MDKENENTKPVEKEQDAAERIEKMIKDGKRLIEEAKVEAKELRRRTKKSLKGFSRRAHRLEKRKEKILNIRIGKDLENKIRTEADRNGTPVSNLVRNILEETFDMVDNLGDNVANLVGDVVSNAGSIAGIFRQQKRPSTFEENSRTNRPETTESQKHDLIDDVPAWQDVTAGKKAACGKCSKEIGRGEKAHMGISDSTGDRLFLCGECFTTIHD